MQRNDYKNLFFYTLIILTCLYFTSCAKKKNKSGNKFNYYHHCSKQSYDNYCSNKISYKPLEYFNFYSHFCEKSYWLCVNNYKRGY